MEAVVVVRDPDGCVVDVLFGRQETRRLRLWRRGGRQAWRWCHPCGVDRRRGVDAALSSVGRTRFGGSNCATSGRVPGAGTPASCRAVHRPCITCGASMGFWLELQRCEHCWPWTLCSEGGQPQSLSTLSGTPYAVYQHPVCRQRVRAALQSAVNTPDAEPVFVCSSSASCRGRPAAATVMQLRTHRVRFKLLAVTALAGLPRQHGVQHTCWPLPALQTRWRSHACIHCVESIHAVRVCV